LQGALNLSDASAGEFEQRIPRCDGGSEFDANLAYDAGNESANVGQSVTVKRDARGTLDKSRGFRTFCAGSLNPRRFLDRRRTEARETRALRTNPPRL
jgi:hypothetical protein